MDPLASSSSLTSYTRDLNLAGLIAPFFYRNNDWPKLDALEPADLLRDLCILVSDSERQLVEQLKVKDYDRRDYARRFLKSVNTGPSPEALHLTMVSLLIDRTIACHTDVRDRPATNRRHSITPLELESKTRQIFELYEEWPTTWDGFCRTWEEGRSNIRPAGSAFQMETETSIAREPSPGMNSPDCTPRSLSDAREYNLTYNSINHDRRAELVSIPFALRKEIALE